MLLINANIVDKCNKKLFSTINIQTMRKQYVLIT